MIRYTDRKCFIEDDDVERKSGRRPKKNPAPPESTAATLPTEEATPATMRTGSMRQCAPASIRCSVGATPYHPRLA